MHVQATGARRVVPTLPLLLVLLGLAAHAGPAGAPFEACDPDTAARLAFLEQRLDERRTYADRWWKIWTGGYALGTVVQSVRAGIEDDDGEQADLVVGAAKALFGTTRLLLFPPNARVGADPMRAVTPDSDAACRDRLAVGEDLLRRNAEESASRWSWKRHVANVAINVVGGVIVAEGFDETDGWTSAGIGIAVGETMTLTHPWTGEDDLEAYERRFASVPPATAPELRLGSWGRGLRVSVLF
jgi:hypothetical protein